ncbi:MAG: hypothetical protein R3C59_02640 [Planctomycetaceae bacterium]
MNPQTSSNDTSRIPTPSPLMLKVARLADAGQIDDAHRLLTSDGRQTDENRNARGVLLMRSGRIEAAVDVLRTLALAPGCTWAKPGSPVIHQTNYAASLLMFGRPLGAVSILADIGDRNHPAVLRLRDAIRRWERGLSWWQRLNWKLGSAPDVPVQLDFAPGDIVDPLTLTPGTLSSDTSAVKRTTQQVV